MAGLPEGSDAPMWSRASLDQELALQAVLLYLTVSPSPLPLCRPVHPGFGRQTSLLALHILLRSNCTAQIFPPICVSTLLGPACELRPSFAHGVADSSFAHFLCLERLLRIGPVHEASLPPPSLPPPLPVIFLLCSHPSGLLKKAWKSKAGNRWRMTATAAPALPHAGIFSWAVGTLPSGSGWRWEAGLSFY